MSATDANAAASAPARRQLPNPRQLKHIASLWPYIWRHPAMLLLALAALVASAAATLAIPLAIRGMVDHGFSRAEGGVIDGYFTALIAVGFLGVGVSLVLFMLALRNLGAARTGAYFSLAPFIGAIIAVVLLGEPLTIQLIAAGMLMMVGLWLHLAERHEHEHLHDALAHEHVHVHDEHHQHEHDGLVTEPHSHWHRHAPLRHGHAHYPDLHHRHTHVEAK